MNAGDVVGLAIGLKVLDHVDKSINKPKKKRKKKKSCSRM